MLTYEGSEIATLSSLDMCESEVNVSTDASGAVTVENISGRVIPELRLFYKNRLETGEYGVIMMVRLYE